jgi:hypothetical protein
MQVVLGRDYNVAQVADMMQLYQSLVSGILGWPYLELPFTPYGRAMAARRQLVGMFQEVVDDARGRLARGEELSGVVGSLVKAEDEEGNRCGYEINWSCCLYIVEAKGAVIAALLGASWKKGLLLLH